MAKIIVGFLTRFSKVYQSKRIYFAWKRVGVVLNSESARVPSIRARLFSDYYDFRVGSIFSLLNGSSCPA